MKSFSMCVVGSGPSGFYVADAVRKLLLKTPENSVKLHVDMIERLPTPYGLVRYGVAPDHTDIKKVAHKFEEMAGDFVNWYGNVTLGADISMKELCGMYDAVVLAAGADRPKPLEIPGEDSQKVLYAKDIVDWYNSNPLMGPSRKAIEEKLLNAKHITVIGHGNVALDICRLLCGDLEKLSQTDIDGRAIEVIRKMHLEKISVVARRGVIDSKFTIKELREVFKMESLSVNVPQFDYDTEKIPMAKRRFMALLKEASKGMYVKPNAKHTVELLYARKPKSIGDAEIAFVKMKPEGTELNGGTPLGGDVRWAETGETDLIKTDLIVISTGFAPHKIPGIPYTPEGTVECEGAKIKDTENAFVAGWAKSGSLGEIAWTIRDAMQVATQIVREMRPKEEELPVLKELLKKRSIKYVTFQ